MSRALESPRRPVAVGYCRVSSRKQADDGGSLEAQREAIIREAVLGGLDVLDVFADGGISGGKGEKSRPGLGAALDAIRSGAASVLIVKHADRLSRDTDYAGHLRTIVKEAGGRLVVIEEAKDDPIRRAVDKMLAELERIRGSQRMKTFHAIRRAAGLPAGPAPYGYETGPDGRLVPLAAEASTVARVLKMHREGASLRAIAAALGREKVPTRTGAAWSPAVIAKIIGREERGEGDA
jgi:site-specific DNA recombinase